MAPHVARPAAPPEFELLACCARTQLTGDATELIHALLRGKLDWDLLFRMASRHGMTALLYWHLNAACPEPAAAGRGAGPQGVPAERMDFLRTCFEENARLNLYRTSELCRILARFEAAGVLAVPFKGPSVAAALYGNLALREFEDLDIVCRERELAKAYEALLALGYRPELACPEPASAGRGIRSAPGGSARPQASLRTPGQYVFSREGDPTPVELHTEVTLRYFPRPVDLDAMWQRLARVPLGGQTVPAFSPEDLLLMLCVHGAKDFWGQLKWICDIGELVRAYPEFDGELALERARTYDGERIVLLGLRLARDLLGTKLPPAIQRRLSPDAQLDSLVAQVRKELLREASDGPGILARALFRVQLGKHFWDGVFYSVRLATTPTERDVKAFRLPRVLFPLYRLLRPLRLLGRPSRPAGPRRPAG